MRTHLLCTVIVSSLFAVLNLSAHASDIKKYGKVEKEYLDMTVFPADTTASAVKIFDVAEMELIYESAVELYFTRHYQIKILDESAKSYADQSIRYWHEDKVRRMKAHTILPNGKKIKVKNFREEEYKKNYKVKKFTLPSVEVGSVLEIEYKVYSKYFYDLEPWSFQSEIPTLESQLSLRLPIGFVFNSKIHNDEQYRRVRMTTEEYLDPSSRRRLEMFIWRSVDLPAVKDEPYISSLKNYRARLDFQFSAYQDRYQSVKFIKDLNTLVDEQLDGRYGSFLKPTGDVKNVVAELTAGMTSGKDKAEALYKFVRDELEHDSYNAYSPREKQDKLLQTRKASGSEKNLLLLAMLRAAGLDAKPVLISTRGNGRIDASVPFLRQYNRTIAFVKVEEEIILSDASDRFIPFGSLPFSALVEVGLILEKDNPQFIRNPNRGVKSQSFVQSKTAISQDGLVTGTADVRAIGYASRRCNVEVENSDSIEDYISDEFAGDLDGIEITRLDTVLKATASDTFKTEFDFELPGFAEIIDDEIYVRPALFHCMSKNVFVSQKREFPVEFGYRSKGTELNTITVPVGYDVVEVPENKVINSKYFTYRRMVTNLGEQLVFSRTLELKNHTVPATDYEQLKHDYARIVDADQEQIVLRAGSLSKNE